MTKKIKNPERYINRLKKRIRDLEEWLDDSNEEIKKYEGETKVDWADNVTDENAASNNVRLGEFKLNDYVVVVGKVTEVKQWFSTVSEGEKPCSSIKFKRLKTKKVETY